MKESVLCAFLQVKLLTLPRLMKIVQQREAMRNAFLKGSVVYACALIMDDSNMIALFVVGLIIVICDFFPRR